MAVRKQPERHDKFVRYVYVHIYRLNIYYSRGYFVAVRVYTIFAPVACFISVHYTAI